MAFVDTPKLALPGSAIKGDGAGTWVAQWNQLCANLEARLTKAGNGSPVGLVAGEYVGQLYYQLDSPVRWYCTLAGAAGVANWSSSATFGGPLTTNAGAVFAQGNVQLATNLKLIIPDGQGWLQRSGGTPDNMNVHGHAARHTPGIANGAWAAAADFVSHSIQQIRHSVALLSGTAISTTALASQTFGAAGAAKCEVTVDTTGRPTTSRGLLYAEFGWTNNDQNAFTAGLYRATAAGTVGAVGTQLDALMVVDSPFPSTSGGIVGVLRYVAGLAAATTHRFALHAEDLVAGAPTIPTVQLTYLDLGTE